MIELLDFVGAVYRCLFVFESGYCVFMLIKNFESGYTLKRLNRITEIGDGRQDRSRFPAIAFIHDNRVM